MTDLTPVQGKKPQPHSHLDGLSRFDLKAAALCYLDRAKKAHQESRKALIKPDAAGAELALYRARERQANQ